MLYVPTYMSPSGSLRHSYHRCRTNQQQQQQQHHQQRAADRDHPAAAADEPEVADQGQVKQFEEGDMLSYSRGASMGSSAAASHGYSVDGGAAGRRRYRKRKQQQRRSSKSVDESTAADVVDQTSSHLRFYQRQRRLQQRRGRGGDVSVGFSATGLLTGIGDSEDDDGEIAGDLDEFARCMADHADGTFDSPIVKTQQQQQELQQQQQHVLISSLPSPPHNCHLMGCERVRLNVSGMHFETRLGVLNQHPRTLLGNSQRRAVYYDHTRREYFLDRHRPTFEAVFNYYQYGGKLKRPPTVTDDIFLAELEFYEIEREVIDAYKKEEGYISETVVLPEHPLQRAIWMLFEYPETSALAFLVAILSVVFTVASIILFCAETLKEFKDSHCTEQEMPNFLDPFFIIESACTAWFTIELLIRFIVCPCKKAFIKDVKNAVDLSAIVPYYVTLTNVLITMSCEGAKSSASLAFLRVVRLIRVFKLTKHSADLQVLVLTFRASVEGLGLFLVALIVCILLFSSTIYYVESEVRGSQIESIPDAFWWAVITMCTVGYGDKVPKGPLGKIIGSVCAVAGVLTLAIPVPIITENFNKFYTHKTGRGRR